MTEFGACTAARASRTRRVGSGRAKCGAASSPARLCPAGASWRRFWKNTRSAFPRATGACARRASSLRTARRRSASATPRSFWRRCGTSSSRSGPRGTTPSAGGTATTGTARPSAKKKNDANAETTAAEPRTKSPRWTRAVRAARGDGAEDHALVLRRRNARARVRHRRPRPRPRRAGRERSARRVRIREKTRLEGSSFSRRGRMATADVSHLPARVPREFAQHGRQRARRQVRGARGKLTFGCPFSRRALEKESTA